MACRAIAAAAPLKTKEMRGVFGDYRTWRSDGAWASSTLRTLRMLAGTGHHRDVH